MRQNGFTDYNEKYWSYFKRIGDYEEIYVSINKESGDIDYFIFDPAFGQPSPANYVDTEYALKMRDLLTEKIHDFINVGIFNYT